MSSVASFYICSLLLQLVYGQGILNVQLHQFENIYNAEIRPENDPKRFCCCDQGNGDCRGNLNDLYKHKCDSTKPCDTSFEVTLTECQFSDPCPTILYSDVFYDTATSTNVNYKFRFFLSGTPRESV